MSKCWICGKEMTKTIGGCEQCNDCGVGLDDLVFRTRNHSKDNSLDKFVEKYPTYIEALDIIDDLEKQLEEKEKDNQFLKKMYLSERTKNDNYHTEKYGLDKPVEELRKIKLNPKEKEIYYKGFDNCERQFATHIAELQQQLKSQPEEIVEKIRRELGLKLKYKLNDEVYVLKICNQINEVLDTILKEYQK